MKIGPLLLRSALSAFLLLGVMPPWQTAQAARPLVTDDARIVDPQSCQLEAWLRFNRDGTERWALPGCNFTGNFEWTFGGSVQSYDGGHALTDLQLQGKTVLRPVEPNDYGVALTFGVGRHPKAENRHNVGALFAYVPVTLSLRDDRFLVHTNLGVSRDRDEGQTQLTWGVAGEAVVNQRLTLIAETYGNNRENAWYQLGVRTWIVPNRVQIDATVGSQFGNQQQARYMSLGLRLLSPQLFP